MIVMINDDDELMMVKMLMTMMVKMLIVEVGDDKDVDLDDDNYSY